MKAEQSNMQQTTKMPNSEEELQSQCTMPLVLFFSAEYDRGQKCT